MESVRASVEPLNTAVNSGPAIFLQASFVGLPLINQALAALHPINDKSFFVTVRGLMQVIASIPIADIKARIEANKPVPPRPPVPPKQNPGPQPPPTHPQGPTCGVKPAAQQPDFFQGVTAMNIFGAGFQGDTVDIIEGGVVIASVDADALGLYSKDISFIRGTFPTKHTVKAIGEKSGRVSNDADFSV